METNLEGGHYFTVILRAQDLKLCIFLVGTTSAY